MRETWEKCQATKGDGTKARMMELLQKHLETKGDDSPFVVLTNCMIAAITREMNRHINVLQDQVKSNFLNTWMWLQGMFRKNCDGEEEQEDVAEKVQKYVIKGRAEVDSVLALITTI